MHCGILNSIPGFYLLDASSPFSFCCDNQRCLQTFTNVPSGAKSSLLRTTTLNHMVKLHTGSKRLGYDHTFHTLLWFKLMYTNYTHVYLYIYIYIYPCIHHSTKCSLGPLTDYVNICWLKRHCGFVVSSLSSGSNHYFIAQPVVYTLDKIFTAYNNLRNEKKIKFLTLYSLCYIPHQWIYLSLHFKYLY